MSKRSFAVVGAGAGGLAMAGHLALEGHRVALFNRTAERISEIEERGGVLLRGVVEGVGRIEAVSSDIAQVIPGADMIIVVVPAFAHRDVARLCAPHLTDGQTVLLESQHGHMTVLALDTLFGLSAGFPFGERRTNLQTVTVLRVMTNATELAPSMEL